MSDTVPSQSSLDARIDDKQKQVKGIIDAEKGLEQRASVPVETDLEKDYAEYSRVLLSEVDKFQEELGRSGLGSAEQEAMLREILKIFLSDTPEAIEDRVVTGVPEAIPGAVDQFNLRRIYRDMNGALDKFRQELGRAPSESAETGTIYEVQDGDTLSKIVESKFGVAWNAGGEDTEKHFAIVMALNGVIAGGRDPNEAPDVGTKLDLSKVNVAALDINKGFEDYLAIESSSAYASALRALVEGRTTGGGGGGARRGPRSTGSGSSGAVPEGAEVVQPREYTLDEAIEQGIVGPQMSSSNRSDYHFLQNGYKWVSDNPDDEGYFMVQEVTTMQSPLVVSTGLDLIPQFGNFSFAEAVKKGIIKPAPWLSKVDPNNSATFVPAEGWEVYLDMGIGRGGYSQAEWRVKKEAVAGPVPVTSAESERVRLPVAGAVVPETIHGGRIPEGLDAAENRMVIDIVTKLISESAIPESGFTDAPFQFEGGWIVFKRAGASNDQIIRSDKAQLRDALNARWEMQVAEKQAQKESEQKKNLDKFIADTVNEFSKLDAENASPFYVKEVTGHLTMIDTIMFAENDSRDHFIIDDPSYRPLASRFGSDITAEKLRDMLNKAWLAKKYGGATPPMR